MNINDTDLLLKDDHQANMLNNDHAGNPKKEQLRLQYEKDAHLREQLLFTYATRTIKSLFIFAGCLIVAVILSVVFGQASPWLISLGTISFLVPTTLLGCFMYHIYHDRSIEKPIREFLAKTPVSEILNEFKEFLITRGK